MEYVMRDCADAGNEKPTTNKAAAIASLIFMFLSFAVRKCTETRHPP